MMHLGLAGIENINFYLNEMEWSFQSGRNGMTSFHSGQNDHSNPAGMEWLHSILAGMESSFHSGWNGMAIQFRPEWNGVIPFRPE